MLEQNLLAYTAQPVPYLGRVDLAAVFFDRAKLASETAQFGKKLSAACAVAAGGSYNVCLLVL